MTTRVRELERRLTALALVVLVFLTATLTLAISAAGSTALVTWWPAVGVACTLVVLTARGWWWWVLPATVLANASANMLFDRPPGFALVLSLVVALEAIVFAYVLRHRPGGLATLATQRDFLRLVVASALASGVGGAVAALVWPHTGGTADAQEYLLTVPPSHAAAMLVVAPVLMSLRRPLLPIRLWELVLQTAALTTTAILVFWSNDVLAMTFVPIPFLVWAAFKFGVRVVAIQLVVVAMIASASTALDRGPFAVGFGEGTLELMAATSMVQTFMVCLVLICVPLAVNVEQNLRLTDHLQASRDLFRANFSESLVAMLVLRGNREGFEIHDCNQQTATLLGRERADVVGKHLSDVLDTATPLSAIAARMTEEHVDAWRGEGSLPGRPETQIALTITRLSGTTGEPMFNAQLLDLTAERVARADLEAERQLSDITLATAASLILLTDLEGTVLRANHAVSTLVGLPPEELSGRPIWELTVQPQHWEHAKEIYAVPFGDGVPRSTESTVIDVDGDEHRVAWTSGVVNDAAGNPAYVVLTGLDITAERHAAGLMEHLLAAAVDTAMIGIDREGRITLFNAGAQSMLGRDEFAALGTPFIDLLVPEELDLWALEREACPTFATLLEHLVDQPPQDWNWRSADGRQALVAMSLRRVTDHSDMLIGYLCLGRDVTQARATQEMLATALDKERQVVERLRSLDSAKDDFVSTVSHELRTPVASIIGYTELLQDGDFGEVPEQQAPVVDAISRNGERLVVLVDNLLALNDLSDQQEPERTRVDLVDVVAAAQRDALATEASRRLEMVFDVPDRPVVVHGDRGQLERALSNVVNNAMKFTEPRGTVSCRLCSEDGAAMLVVADTGLGIPREEQHNLFKRFWRSSTAQSRHIQGTGLGLSIVEAIVEAHGGSIALESEHLKGTTVTVRLPVCAEAVAVRPG